MKELGKNLVELEGIVQGKQGTLKVVEDGEFLLNFSTRECVHSSHRYGKMEWKVGGPERSRR